MESLKGKKIALVGGGGFIGHNLAIRLKSLGAEVMIFDSLMVNNLTSFYSSKADISTRHLYQKILHERQELLFSAGIPLEVVDARDYSALCKALGEFGPESIVHLAAVAHANKSNKDPYTTFDHSLRTLENALDYARAKSIGHFVFFSSSMVYGHFEGGSVIEESICNPLGIYGALKFSGEKLVIAYNQVFDLPFTIVRPSALYGERCVSRRVIQIFIENAIQGKEINIAGDGSDRLDFTYIDDFVAGIVAVLSRKKAKDEIFNITHGASRSLADVATILKEEFPDLTVNYQEKDKLMPDRGTLCVDKAKELIGYDPKWPIEKGIPKYVDWYRNKLKLGQS